MESIEGDHGQSLSGSLKSLFLTRLKHYRQILLILFCLFSNITLEMQSEHYCFLCSLHCTHVSISLHGCQCFDPTLSDLLTID